VTKQWSPTFNILKVFLIERFTYFNGFWGNKMITQIGRYKFEKGSGKNVKKLCALCLDDITKAKDHKCLSKMSIVVKKPDYGLIRVPRSEPVVDRMLKITRNNKDNSRSFVILFVNNTFVGYKSNQATKFIPGFSKKEYKNILEEYEPKKRKKSSMKSYKAIR